jgi:hypothetical protein
MTTFMTSKKKRERRGGRRGERRGRRRGRRGDEIMMKMMSVVVCKHRLTTDTLDVTMHVKIVSEEASSRNEE